MNPVDVQGLATFSWVWRGAVDSDTGGSCGIANEPSPDTVAMLWDSPPTAVDTRVTFVEPVEMVAFEYSVDTGFGSPTVVFFDEQGIQIGTGPLNVCGSSSCGNGCSDQCQV